MPSAAGASSHVERGRLRDREVGRGVDGGRGLDGGVPVGRVRGAVVWNGGLVLEKRPFGDGGLYFHVDREPVGYTLSLHDALPICHELGGRRAAGVGAGDREERAGRQGVAD